MEDIILKTVDYIKKNISYFFIFDKLETDFEGQMKSLVELAFFYELISKHSKERYNLQFIEKYIIDILDRVDIIELFKKNVNSLTGVATLEKFCLTYDKSRYSKDLLKLIEEDRIDLLLERTPFRILDLKYSLDKAEISNNLPSYNTLYRKTVIGKKLPIFYYTSTSMYSLTHTVFYITDLGRKDCVINEKKEKFIEAIRIIMGERIMSKDFDLLGELVLSSLFLNIDNYMKDLIDFSIQLIINNQEEDGVFPPPNKFEYRTNYEAFRNNYHTTIVCLGALLCYQEKQLSGI